MALLSISKIIKPMTVKQDGELDENVMLRLEDRSLKVMGSNPCDGIFSHETSG